MSANLAQFLNKERQKLATVSVDIPEVRRTLDEIISLLYPQRGSGADLNQIETRLIKYINAVKVLNPDLKSEEITNSFLQKLPDLAQLLDLDVKAAFSGDPAAYSEEEIIITYPGFYAVCIYRLANVLYSLGVPLIPRLMSEYAHEKTGIDIHPGSTIGESFFIDHGTGCVFGETTHIGNNVKIYQGVTLGALSVKKKLQSQKRHPTIEDDVVIYANTTILGGQTVVGKGSVIGGNVWLTESVPNGSRVFNKLESVRE